jgi:hypothetical protein
MLALLNELRQVLGHRGLLGFLVLTVVGVIAFEIMTNARAYYETYNTAQTAHWAAMQAQALAEKAKYEAAAAQAVAENAAKQKAAEADKANAEARTAEIVALNAKQLQKGAAEKSEGEGKAAQAVGHYAELRQAAEAHEKIALAEKTAADAQEARAKAAISTAIAGSMGVLNTTRIGGDEAVSSLEGVGGPMVASSQKPDYGRLATDSYRANQYKPNFSATSPVAPVTQNSFDGLTCSMGINGNCPPEKAVPRGSCAEKLAMWNGWKRTSNAAFAVGQSGSCGWSVSKASPHEAHALAVQICANNHGKNCRVIAEK